MTKQRGRPKKNIDVQNTPALKQEAKANRLCLGDKVRCTTHPGVWELVWYKEGDTTCAIQNEKYRCIVKTAILTKEIN
jgi:hypothetical protein